MNTRKKGKNILMIATLFIAMLMITNNSYALNSLYFDPSDQVFNIGDTIYYNIMADIDEGDAIMGFGFDLSFDNGSTFVAGPGGSGSSLTFDSFTPNGVFAYDSRFDDGDTISGWVGFSDPDVWGTGITLGTFQFTAYALGTERIFLGADDLGLIGIEGLVPGHTATITDSFMPNNLTAIGSAVPEPSITFLVGSGLISLLGFRRLSRLV